MLTAFQGAWATFSSSKTAEKMERSSALSICRGLVPMILTPFLYRGTARLFGIWPPTDIMQPPHAWKRHLQYQPLGVTSSRMDNCASISLLKMFNQITIFSFFSSMNNVKLCHKEINDISSNFPGLLPHDCHVRFPYSWTWMCDVCMCDNQKKKIKPLCILHHKQLCFRLLL